MTAPGIEYVLSPRDICFLLKLNLSSGVLVVNQPLKETHVQTHQKQNTNKQQQQQKRLVSHSLFSSVSSSSSL